MGIERLMGSIYIVGGGKEEWLVQYFEFKASRHILGFDS